MKIKKFLTYSGITLVVIIAILLVLPFVINLDKYISKITVPASKAIGRQVSIEHLRLTILTGLGVELKGVAVAEKAPGKASFVSVDDIDVGVKLLPLLRKEISISKVILTKPEINIKRYPDGTYNFSDLLKKPEQKTEKKPEKITQTTSSGIPEGFSLDKLAVSDGVINITNIERGKEHTYGLNHINLGVYGFNVKKAFKVTLGVSFDKLKDARLDINGDVGPTGQQISMGKLPLNIIISLKHIDIPYVLSLAGVKAQTVSSGTLDVEEKLNSESSGIMDINGKIELSGLALTNGTVSPFSISNNLEFTPKEMVLNIKDVTLKSDGIDLGVKGSTAISTKTVNVNLFSRNLSLDKLIEFYSPMEKSLPKDLTINGDGSITTTISTSNGVMGINGSIDLSKAKITYQKMFIKPASVPLSVSYDISKHGDAVAIKDIKFILDRLAMDADGTVVTSGDMNGNIDLHTNEIQVQSLQDVLPMIKSYNAAGSFALSAAAQGAFKKPKELAVQGRLQVKNVSAVIASLPKPLKSLDMDASFTRNSIALKSMSAQIGQSTIKANGSINDFSAPQGKLDITSPYLNVDELLPESKQQKQVEQPKQAEKAKAPEQPSLIDKANLTVLAHVQKGIVKKAAFTDMIAAARVVKGSIILDKFNVKTFSGSIAANGTVGMKGAEPYNVRLKTTGLNLGDMLDTFTSYKDVMSGRLGTDIALNGNAKDLKRTVSGNGVITVTDGEIKTFSLLSKLTDIAKIASLGAGKTTKFSTLKLTAAVDHGKVTSKDTKLSSNDLVVSSTGYFDLDGNLNYRGIGILSKPLSGRIGGTTGQLIKDEHGQVEIPFLLTGDIRKPSFSLDQEVFQQRLKEAAKKQVIQELNKQLNKELKTNNQLKQIEQNKNLQDIKNKGSKALENFLK